VSEYSSATHWLGYFILFTQWNKEMNRDNPKRLLEKSETVFHVNQLRISRSIANARKTLRRMEVSKLK
jgi:hypothetical protein